MAGTGQDRPLIQGTRVRQSWALRTWLVLLVLATAAPLIAYGLFHVIDSYLAQRAALIEKTTATAHTLVQLVTRELDRDVAELELIAEGPAFERGDYSGLTAAAGDLLARFGPGAAVVAYDQGGRPIGGSVPASLLTPATHRTISEQVFAAKAPVISYPDGQAESGFAVSLDVPISHGSDVVGDLSLLLPAARIQAIVASERLPAGWASVVLNGADRAVARFPPGEASFRPSTSPALHRLLASGAGEDTADITLADGASAIAVLARTPRYGWSAVVAIPQSEIFAPLRATLREMAAVGALALALSLGLALLIANRLARPITSLARFALALDGDETLLAHEPGLLEADSVAEVLRHTVHRRRLAESTADNAELRAARLIEAVPCGVIGFDRDGSWSFVNRTTCELLRRSSAELLGFTIRTPDLDVRRVDGSPIPPEERVSARALRGEAVHDLEVSMRRGTGERISLLLSAVPMRDRDGRIIGALTAMLDVTERRAAQVRLDNLLLTLEARVREEVAAREAAQQEAAQAQKMQALGELAGGVAHDFNNALQAITGAVGLIEQRSDEPQAVRRFARAASAAAERGAAIAGRLLTFARRGELRAVPVEASTLLRDTAEILALTLGANVTVRTEIAGGVGWLMADPAQLQTVLVNLAANARDAMPGGGTLVLRAREEAVGAGPHPAELRPGRYVLIEAVDTGAGMDARTLARATEPFFTTKPVHKGTGLGLPMARGFAEQLGGGLSITSAPGQGTTVRLWLPATAPPARNPAGEAGGGVQGGAAVGGGLRLLLVEDEADSRAMVAEELSERGFLVEQAADAAAALDLLSARRFDVLVTDYGMPGESGLDLIAAARERHRRLPALLLTGLGADPALVAAANADGPTEAVGKPVRAAELASRIVRLAAAAR